MSIHTGQMLGRCRLGGLLGQGSMGQVFDAMHTTLQMPVAVKVIRSDISLSPEGWRFRERLAREARIMARLNHPGLVRVLDFGEEEGHAYLVMEKVEGQTLETWLRNRPPLEERLALRIIGNLCVALHVAHQEGIVHRDLKPANILVDMQGRMKISDMGLARDNASAAVTEASSVAGTPHFIAPECLLPNSEPDVRADIYAMGILFYRLVYGTLPFEGSVAQVLHAHATRSPQWTPPVGSSFSPGTLYLIRRMLEKSPDRRMPTAVAVVQACREQIARLDAHEKNVEEIRQRKQDAGGSSKIRADFRERLSIRSQTGDGLLVEHASMRERLLIWGMAIVLIALTLRSCM